MKKPRLAAVLIQEFSDAGSLLQLPLRRHLAVNFVIVELLCQEDGTVTRFMKNYEALIPIRLLCRIKSHARGPVCRRKENRVARLVFGYGVTLIAVVPLAAAAAADHG